MALNFNGSTQYADVASSPITSGAVTISAWVRPTSTTGGCVAAIGRSTSYDGVFLSLDGTRRPLIEVAGSAGATDIQANHTVSCATGAWSHIAATTNGSNSHRSWKDGVGGTVSSSPSSAGSLNHISVGAAWTWGGPSGGSYFNGAVGEVGIWNTTLTANEIAALAAGDSPLTVRRANLVFYSRMLESSTPSLDEVAGANLTWNNSPAKAGTHPSVATSAVILQPTTAPQSFSQATNADPWTFTGVTVDKCPNRALIAFVMMEGNGVTGDRSVTGITYGGTSLIKLADQDAPGWGGCEIWYLHDPIVGTASLVVDLDGADKGVCAVIVGQRIDEAISSARLRTAVKTSGTGTSATVTVSGVTGDDLVFSGLHIDGDSHATVPGANQTELVDRISDTGTNTGVVNTQPGVDGGVMSNTWTGSNPYALIGSAFQGAPPGATTGYSEFLGAGSATCDVFRIPGVDINSGSGFVAYALVRPRSIAVRSMSILEFRSESNLDRVLLEIDSGGNYAWANQTGSFLGSGYHYAQEELWTLIVWEKGASGGGGYSPVRIHVCEDPGVGSAWYHYDIGYDSDPDETINGIVSVSNFDFSGLTGDIACWGVWADDWVETSGSPDADLEAVFSGWSSASLLGTAYPPFAHFELNNQGNAPDLAGNGCWHDSSTAQVISDPTVPWDFGISSGGTTTPKSLDATVASTTGFVRSTGKLINATKATTATFVRRTSKSINATVSKTVTAFKRVTKGITATQGKTVTLAATKVFPRVMNATSSSVSSVVKRVGKFANATSTSVATMTRVKALLRAITATSPTTSTFSKRITKSITATVSKTVNLTATRVFLKALSAISTVSLGSGGPPPPTTYADEVLLDTPVAYWKLTDLTDSSGNSRTLTAPVGGVQTSLRGLITGATPGGAKELNGFHSVGYTRADDAGLSPSPNMTWECWVYMPPGGIGLSGMNILKKGPSTIGTRSNGRVYWQVETPSGATWLDSTTLLTSNQLYHIVGTAAAGTYRLYINGVEEPGSFSFETTIADNSSPFSIGGNAADATFLGTVDEVAVYNTALSSARVLAHYNAGIKPRLYEEIITDNPMMYHRQRDGKIHAQWVDDDSPGGAGDMLVWDPNGGEVTDVPSLVATETTDPAIKYIAGTNFWSGGSNLSPGQVFYRAGTTSDVSLSFWMRPSATGLTFPSSYRDVVNKGTQYGIEISASKLRGVAYLSGFTCRTDDAVPEVVLAPQTTLVVGQIYHVGYSYERATSTISVYVNGVLDSQWVGGSTNISISDAPSNNFVMGAFSDVNHGYDGELDEVALYHTALSPTRFAAHYNAGILNTGGTGGGAIIKRVGKLANTVSASTSTFVRRVGKVITRTVTPVVTLTRGQAQTLSATAVSVTSSTLSYMRVSLRTLTATVGNTTNFVRRIGKPVTSISSSVVTYAKRITKSFSTIASNVSTVVRTNVQSIVLSVSRPVVATLTKVSTRVRALTAVSNTISTTSRAIFKPIFAQSSISVVINKLSGVKLSGVSDSISSISRSPRKTLSAVSNTVASLLKQKFSFQGVVSTLSMLVSTVNIVKKVSQNRIHTTEKSIYLVPTPSVNKISTVSKSLKAEETGDDSYALITVSTTETVETVR